MALTTVEVLMATALLTATRTAMMTTAKVTRTTLRMMEMMLLLLIIRIRKSPCFQTVVLKA